MKCDELEKFDATSNAERSAGIESRYAYDADEVDEAIEEFKEVYKESVDVKVKIWERCKNLEKQIDELKREHHRERHEYIDMVAQLKAKLVEQESENRRLKRALWMARAEWARSSALSYHLIESHPNKDAAATYKRKANKWEKVKDKCLAKEKEYK